MIKKLILRLKTLRKENKIYTVLYKYRQEFADNKRNMLNPHYSNPSHFCGLPKILKHDIPLKSIVSFPYNKLAKYLL